MRLSLVCHNLLIVLLACLCVGTAAHLGKAAASSGTYGFNAGLEIDLDVLEEQLSEAQQRSVASTLSAGNTITINANNTATIQGSHLQAGEGITIDSQDLNVLASQDLSTRETSTEHRNVNISIDLYGGSGGGVNLSSDSASSSRREITQTNASLLANNITINTRDTTQIKGADIAAGDTLSLNTQTLHVASVQNSTKDRSQSQGASAGFSSSGINSAGLSNARARSVIKNTVDTQLLGETVDITVAEATTLRGATIAAVDEDGNDNQQLTLVTNTLEVGSLNNTVEARSTSASVGVGQTVSLDYSNDNQHSKTKTLGTVGEGEIVLGDAENSNTRLLNRDIDDNEVAIYDIESHQGLSGSLDTRLLTERGRTAIAEDILKSEMIVNTIELIATTERVGVEDFFSETDKAHRTYEAVKTEIANTPALANALQNPNLNPAEKEQLLNQITSSVMAELGYESHENRLVNTDVAGRDGEAVQGYYSDETGHAYINDQHIENTEELITTAGHETSHAIDRQSEEVDLDNTQDNESYADNYGENLAEYTEFALEVNGYEGGLASENNRVGTETSERVAENNAEFEGLDKDEGDNRLTPTQEAEQREDLEACDGRSCEMVTNQFYYTVSAVQGAAEMLGMASGAVEQTIEDVVALVDQINELIEDPEEAERVVSELGGALNRLHEIYEGSPVTEEEKEQIRTSLDNAGKEINEAMEEIATLDNGGLSGSFEEGENYGAYLAGIVGLGKLDRVLRGLGDGPDAPNGPDLDIPRDNSSTNLEGDGQVAQVDGLGNDQNVSNTADTGTDVEVEVEAGNAASGVATNSCAGGRCGSAVDRIYGSTRPMTDEFPELAGVNPHYVDGASAGVNATVDRLTGRNPNAVAAPSAGYGTPNDLLPSAPWGFSRATTPSSVTNTLLGQGDGAVAVVRIQQSGGVEHVIVGVNRGGTVHYVDPQLGSIVDLQPNLTVIPGYP